jgi:hypothetical protein
MSIVLPFAEKIVVEKVSADILFPRSLATAITCTYSRQFSGFYLGAIEPSVRIQNGVEELPES